MDEETRDRHNQWVAIATIGLIVAGLLFGAWAYITRQTQEEPAQTAGWTMETATPDCAGWIAGLEYMAAGDYSPVLDAPEGAPLAALLTCQNNPHSGAYKVSFTPQTGQAITIDLMELPSSNTDLFVGAPIEGLPQGNYRVRFTRDGTVLSVGWIRVGE